MCGPTSAFSVSWRNVFCQRLVHLKSILHLLGEPVMFYCMVFSACREPFLHAPIFHTPHCRIEAVGRVANELVEMSGESTVLTVMNHKCAWPAPGMEVDRSLLRVQPFLVLSVFQPVTDGRHSPISSDFRKLQVSLAVATEFHLSRRSNDETRLRTA
jgi:hypothetical protein